jgi:uncharacterized iron-regulated membrane protein
MGVLFGLANQLILVFFASGLVVMVIIGYVMWWRRRPGLTRQPTVMDAWRQSGPVARAVWVLVAAGLGVSLPVLGWSLLALVICDIIVTYRAPSVGFVRSQG